MDAGIRLGRLAGIEISINWSWLVVFVLFVWTLAAGIFPATNPRLSTAAHVAMAIVATVLFFVSLLLHELGHALRARREGMEIDGITLWLFGGVARFRGMFPSPGAEFRVAIAGPLVSLALGAVCTLIALAHGLPQAVDAVLAWLGYVNLTLLVFNLVPALPLDGGRVLRALLWRLKGDLVSATRIAGAVGAAFGFLFIGGGLALLIFQGTFSGAWLAFVGFFLLQASRAEVQYSVAQESLAGLRVRDLMTPDPIAVPADLTLGRFVDEILWRERHTTYPVVEDGRPVGLLPFRCVAQHSRREWDGRRVRDCMIDLEHVPVLDPDEPAADALAKLGASPVSHGLVVAGGRLAGIVSLSDIARALQAPPRRRDAVAARPRLTATPR